MISLPLALNTLLIRRLTTPTCALLCTLVLHNPAAFAQAEAPAAAQRPAAQVLPAIQLRPAIRAAVAVAAPAPVLNDKDLAARRWTRGLIQQELHAVHSVCKLNPEQAKELVDAIESQWKSKLASTFRSYAESNQRGGVDFEFRVENAVKAWVQASTSLSEDQKKAWDEEIESRNSLRKRVVIGKMVSDAERKYGLTSSQMQEAEKLLLERWKEAWWVMYRHGTTPETKFAWISTALSDAQRTAGADPASTRQEYYMSGGSVDLPSKSLADRFTMAGVSSDESIPLQPQPQPVAPNAQQER